jgi:hypothetical protein
MTSEPIVVDWPQRDMTLLDATKEEIVLEYTQNADAFIPEFVSLEDLAQIYLNNPGFHSSFQDFMAEWQEEDNAVECEF